MECKEYKTIRREEIGFADPRLAYTKFLARYVLNLARFMTIPDVSKHLGLSWDLIKSIQRRYLEKEYSRSALNTLERMAIDEIYVLDDFNFSLFLLVDGLSYKGVVRDQLSSMF